MRWFHHMSNSHDDERLALLLAQPRGLELYGFYWCLLEFLADNMSPEQNHTALRATLKKWAGISQITPRKFVHLLNRVLGIWDTEIDIDGSENGRFLAELEQTSKKMPHFLIVLGMEQNPKSHDVIMIACPKLLEYRDEWSKRQARTQEKLRSNSVVAPTRPEEKRG